MRVNNARCKLMLRNLTITQCKVVGIFSSRIRLHRGFNYGMSFTSARNIDTALLQLFSLDDLRRRDRSVTLTEASLKSHN